MPQISVVLALASPLLHARLRAELLLDPTIRVLHDTGIAAQAVVETARLRPQVLLCDREMLVDPDLAALAQRMVHMPPIVLVTVYKEGVPTRHVLPIAGTIPFDMRRGELASRLNQILEQARAEKLESSQRPRVVSELQHRFTSGEVEAVTTPKREQFTVDETSLLYNEEPVPSKSSHLAEIGFLRSVFDGPGPTSDKQ
ncbi:MAG: hypothetical protein JWO42_3547 [Chloroflexi bacterium]|nr:hypothetical protein [Chloroflexota bacterium]